MDDVVGSGTADGRPQAVGTVAVDRSIRLGDDADRATLADGRWAPETNLPQRYVNRELSWLDFNARVLALASDESDCPLLERVKFSAIFSQNLDEFFQVRVSGLKDQVAAGVVADLARRAHARASSSRRSSSASGPSTARLEQVFLDELVPALAEVGIVFSRWDDLDEDDREYLVEEFEHRIFPVLTPLAVDPGHPFPYISDLSLNLAVVRPRSGHRRAQRFARVKVPPVLPRFVVMPDGERFVPLEQVIAAHLDRLFPGMDVEEPIAFRVTRNADLTLEEEEADDLLAAVEMELRRRRFGRAVRLEVDARASRRDLDLLIRELDVPEASRHQLHRPARPRRACGRSSRSTGPT